MVFYLKAKLLEFNQSSSFDHLPPSHPMTSILLCHINHLVVPLHYNHKLPLRSSLFPPAWQHPLYLLCTSPDHLSLPL